MPAMRLHKIAEDGDVVLVRCEGDISQLQFPGGADPLGHLLGSDVHRRKVLLDLETTAFIDSSGISWLVVQQKKFSAAGGMLVLYAIPPRIDDVMKLLKLASVLHLAKDEAAARALVQGGTR